MHGDGGVGDEQGTRADQCFAAKVVRGVELERRPAYDERPRAGQGVSVVEVDDVAGPWPAEAIDVVGRRDRAGEGECLGADIVPGGETGIREAGEIAGTGIVCIDGEIVRCQGDTLQEGVVQRSSERAFLGALEESTKLGEGTKHQCGQLAQRRV